MHILTPRRPRLIATAIVAVACLATSASAFAASLATGTYTGQTGQRHPVKVVATGRGAFHFAAIDWSSSCRSGQHFNQSTHTDSFHLTHGHARQRITYKYHQVDGPGSYTAYVNLLITAREHGTSKLAGTIGGGVLIHGKNAEGSFTDSCTLHTTSWSAAH